MILTFSITPVNKKMKKVFYMESQYFNKNISKYKNLSVFYK